MVVSYLNNLTGDWWTNETNSIIIHQRNSEKFHSETTNVNLMLKSQGITKG